MELADLWSLLHEGGLAVETQSAGKTALRTLLQLDGDQLTFVALPILEPLSPEDQRLLAVRHADAVRARSVGMLADGRTVLPWLRHAALVGFGGGELYSVVTHVSLGLMPGAADWMGLLRDQMVWPILLILRAVLPWVVRWIVAGVLKFRYTSAARRLGEVLHRDTRAMFAAGK